jgi:mannose-1-phosphate guanylyltransferase
MKNYSGKAPVFTDVIILAGGIGERLWPLSTKEHPKQFIQTEKGSFFQMALRRAVLLKPSRSILAVTRREFKDIAAEQCAGAEKLLTRQQFEFLRDKLTILPEPVPKHTAAAVQYALAFIERGGAALDSGAEKNSSVLVLTSDHIIETDGQFLAGCANAAASVAENYFVCFGIRPLFPATGFGYFETGKEIAPFVREILAFKEKPDETTARAFIERGNYWWNSGMFAFNKDFFQSEIKKYAPGLYAPFAALLKTKPREGYCKDFRFVRQWARLNDVYGQTEAVSIDCAIAEKTSRARCVIAEFSWDDIGSWDAFAGRLPSRQENAVLVESENCSVYSDIPVALCGVSDLIVSIRDGKALVLKKGKSALIRDAARNVEHRKGEKKF